MLEVSVFGFSRAAEGATPRLLGHFDAQVGPFRMSGCSLNRADDGRLVVHPPLARYRKSYVKITDPEVRDRLAEAAVAAYRAMGGRLESAEG